MNTSSGPVAAPASIGQVARLAFEFWQRAGAPSGFPRDPEPLLALQLPLAVHPMPGLTGARVVAWAAGIGVAAQLDAPGRPLRGCLLALRGRGFLLVDPQDPADERRLTVAHELGHFLIEIHEPRRRAIQALGPEAAALLDSVRPPSLDERLRAILADVPLGPQVHLMTREPDGSIGCPRVAAAECGADAFALELLAPSSVLRPEVVAVAHLPRQQRWSLVTELLCHHFGLPAINAGGYARALVEELTGGESMTEWLGASSPSVED